MKKKYSMTEGEKYAQRGVILYFCPVVYGTPISRHEQGKIWPGGK
jgi:hypothetical protein